MQTKARRNSRPFLHETEAAFECLKAALSLALAQHEKNSTQLWGEEKSIFMFFGFCFFC
jgi:hypothetical protein